MENNNSFGSNRSEERIVSPMFGKLDEDVMSDVEDESVQGVSVREDLHWLENQLKVNLTYEELCKWPKTGPPKRNIDDENDFVDSDLLAAILRGKELISEYDEATVGSARARANPFETIRKVFFMNRATLKMANIDAATGFMFTEVDRDPRLKNVNAISPYYFADVCAGPGGFTEYILWRKKWFFKGFGFTLKGTHDFKLHELSTCVSPNSFRAYYGSADDGDIYNLRNIEDFKFKVLRQTDGLGVHFMMSDGGFSVDGHENLQEVLSKRLYVCQCLMALEIVRPMGHFVTKVFDLFTKFSVGLVYLMHQCFERVAVLKPNASRPANSERYLIGKYLKNNATTDAIKSYLKKIINDLHEMRTEPILDIDILEIVPMDILKTNSQFYKYIRESNNSIGARQRMALITLSVFCESPNLVDRRQTKLRSECLSFWRIPDRKKLPPERFDIDDFMETISKPEFMLIPPRAISSIFDLMDTVTTINDWDFVPLISTRQNNYCYFFAGVGQSKVFKLVGNKWIQVKNFKLNKGTLLYGELVKETQLSESGEKSEKLCLQVIDALRLEGTSLADMPFVERLACVQIFCKALNFEGTSTLRIRAKPIFSLRKGISSDDVVYNNSTSQYEVLLETLGFDSMKETFNINSILYFKSGRDYSFDTRFGLRTQAYINEGNLTFDQIMLRNVQNF